MFEIPDSVRPNFAAILGQLIPAAHNRLIS
jgi:hypothetical protein